MFLVFITITKFTSLNKIKTKKNWKIDLKKFFKIFIAVFAVFADVVIHWSIVDLNQLNKKLNKVKEKKKETSYSTITVVKNRKKKYKQKTEIWKIKFMMKKYYWNCWLEKVSWLKKEKNIKNT